MTQFYTVATINYLPYAVTLIDSVKEHHPEFEVCICLADYLSPEVIAADSLMSKYPILQLHEIEAEEFDFITENYNAMQLANCSKVLFAEYFLYQKMADQVIFADSDILFFNRLPDYILQEHDIIFTPHFTSAPPIAMKRQELEVLNAGLLNGGFFKFRRAEETRKLIDWLRERSVKECFYDFSRGYYGEQLWLNFVPLYFKNVLIDPNYGLNVAYWNLHERKISLDADQFIVNHSYPLSFFHFSGWDYNAPEEISKWALITAGVRPDIRPLLSTYHNALLQNGYEKYINIPNYYTANNKSAKMSFFQSVKYKILKRK